MLLSIIFFLPCIISLIWFVSFSFKIKTSRQKLFMWMQLASAVYYAAYASFISPSADYAAMVRLDIVCVPTCILLLTLLSIYLHMHIRRTHLQAIHLFMLAPAVFEGTVVALLYYLIGLDNAESFIAAYDKAGGVIPREYDTENFRLFLFFDETLINIFCAIFVIAIFVQSMTLLRRGGYRFGDVFRFFFKGNTTTPSRAIAVLVISELLLLMPLLGLGRSFLMQMPALGVAMSLLLAVVKHCTCHVEYFSDSLKEVTLYLLSHVDMVKKMPSQEPKNMPLQERKSDAVKEEKPAGQTDLATPVAPEAEEHPSEEPEAVHAKTYAVSPKMEKTAEAFRKLMEEERLFTDDDLTLNGISERMGIGRTTLSMVIQNKYGKPFREVLNDYRIEAVKQHLLADPTATQESLAYACGFKDASSLNRKFKEAVGETPLTWLTKK